MELSNRMDSIRLQNDGTWRRSYHGEGLRESDFTSRHVFELVRRQIRAAVVEAEGVTHQVGKNGMYYHVLVKRDRFPKTPSKEQLRSVIRHGDDGVTNSLVLKVYGFFELRNFSTMDIQIDDPALVFRYETFGEENGYVGGGSADDHRYIDDLYTTFLEGWLSHLRSGATNMYFASEARRSEEAILADIDAMRGKWEEVFDEE